MSAMCTCSCMAGIFRWVRYLTGCRVRRGKDLMCTVRRELFRSLQPRADSFMSLVAAHCVLAWVACAVQVDVCVHGAEAGTVVALFRSNTRVAQASGKDHDELNTMKAVRILDKSTETVTRNTTSPVIHLHMSSLFRHNLSTESFKSSVHFATHCFYSLPWGEEVRKENLCINMSDTHKSNHPSPLSNDSTAYVSSSNCRKTSSTEILRSLETAAACEDSHNGNPRGHRVQMRQLPTRS